VAAWLDDAAAPVDAGVRERLAAAVAALRGAGVEVDESARPAFALAQAIDVYRRLMLPITAAVMRDAEFAAVCKQADAGEPDPREETGRFLRDLGLRHRDWLLLHEERERLRALWADFFRRFDVLLCPIAPVPAPRHDHAEPIWLRRLEVDGGLRPYTDLFAWPGLVGVAWLPASAVPVGRTRQGLPVGIQVVGPFLEDRTPLAFAAHLEALLGGFEAPAGVRELR
jgi:amidase